MAISPSHFIAAFAVSTALATPLLAQSTAPSPVPAENRMRLSAVIAGLEDQGYRILDVDVGRRHIEVEALTKDGKEVDLEVNPVDGKIISIHHDI